MLVVSNIDLGTDLPTMKPTEFLKSSVKDSVLNLTTDYRYLKTGYYVSTHAEVLGDRVVPSSESIIDVSRTPILLLKATKAGIPSAPCLTTDSVKQIMSAFDFPVIIFPVNPFSYEGFKTAKNRSALYRAVKSLSMNYKFAVCAQPLRGRVVSVKCILGKCHDEGNVAQIAEKVYEVFRIPLCRIYVQVFEDEARLCGLQPLRTEEVLPSDAAMIMEEARGILSKGDCLVG